MPDFDSVYKVAYHAVNKLSNWLETYVDGVAIERDDRRSYALHIALALMDEMPCRCGRNNNCLQQHTFSAQPASRLTEEQFIYRAVIGPKGLITNSIIEGMAFPFLREEYALRNGPVGFKQCSSPTCQQMYEGTICPYCQTGFDPITTKLFAQDWLVVEGVYLPVYHWGCPAGAGRNKHYYEQKLCRSKLVEEYPQVRCRVVHDVAQPHDRCPWCGCPEGNPEHGLRGTALWIHRQFVGNTSQSSSEQSRFLAVFFESLVEGARTVIEDCEEWQLKLLHQIGDNPLAIGESLLENDFPSIGKIYQSLDVQSGRPSESTVRRWLCTICRQMRTSIYQALVNRGIDEETIADYLRVDEEIEMERRREVFVYESDSHD